MKSFLKLISFSGLALTLVPSFFVFAGLLSADSYYTLASAGMILWFGTAVFWIRHEKTEE